MDNTPDTDALYQRLQEVAYALDDIDRTIDSLRGVLEVGRRELGHKAALLREMSPGILPSTTPKIFTERL